MGKGFIPQVILILVGLFLIIIGIVSFFVIKSATKKAILDALVIDGPNHKNYADWTTEWDEGDEAAYYEYHLWNLTNPREWAAGTAKANFAEIGPFVYRRYIDKVNISFSDGGNQVSYKERKQFIFQPDLSVSDDQTTPIFNINPFYVTAINQSGGQEGVFDMSLAAGALSTFNDSLAWGSSATQPAGTTVTGFSQAFGGMVTLTAMEAAVALGAFAGNVTNLVGYYMYITQYSTAVAAGQAATAAGTAAAINGAFPGGPDFQNFFNFPPTSSMETKATLVLKYAASVGAGVRASLIAGGAGSEGSLLFRQTSARGHIFGPDPLLYALSGYTSGPGYVANHSSPDKTTGQTTCYTGKNDESQVGMDFFTEVEDITVSTAYHKYMRNNATGSGNTVTVNSRTQTITFWGSQYTANENEALYFSDVERLLPLVKGEVVEHEGMETLRYNADLASALSVSYDWNISHAGFTPLFYWGGAPLFMSAPHQQYAESPYDDAIDSNVFSYNDASHKTFLDFEPTLGLPLRARQAVQLNVKLNLTSTSYAPVVSGISEPDMMVPLVWFAKQFTISPDGGATLRKAVVGAVVLRRALLGVFVALGAVLFLIGAGLTLDKGLSGGSGEDEKKTDDGSPTKYEETA